MKRFMGKTAVVTGAGNGIGEAYALAFAAERANVVVADIDDAGAARVVKEIDAAGGRAVAVHTDVSDEASTKALGEAAVAKFGGVDVLVNNAGLYRNMEIHSLLDIPMAYWQKFLDISVNGSLLCSRAVVGSMTERGGGSIINQSSTGAYMGAGAYSVAKLALHSLTHSLARELGGRNIRVNAIAPGPTDTEATRQLPQEIIDMILAQMPLPRLAAPSEMADAVLFLCSDEAKWITGVVLNVDGGQMMKV